MGRSSFEVVGDVAWFRLDGEQDLVGGVHQITDAILRAKALGLGKLLVDITKIEGVEPSRLNTPYPCFVEGAHRCPPEDVGGTLGYEDLLEAVTTLRHPQRRTMLD